MFIFRRALIAVVTCLTCLSLPAQTAPTPTPTPTPTPHVLKLANEYPATSLPGEGDTAFARRVAELTAGKVEIQTLFDAKSGFKTAEQLTAVRDRKIDLGDHFAGALGSHEPIFLLSSLPFLTANNADAHRLFDLARPQYEAAFARANQKLLFATPWPPSGLWTKRAINDLAAVAELKLRTYDSTSSAVFARLGATSANISFADAMAKLKSGEVDAVLSSGDGGAGRKLWEFLDHFTAIEYATPLSLVTINLDVWNALDASSRAAINQAAAETETLQWQRARTRVEENYTRMRENKMTLTPMIAPTLRKALAAAASAEIDAWAARTAEGKMILERYRGGR